MQEMGVVPHTFTGITAYPSSRQQVSTLPGQVEGVYITLSSTDYQFILNKIVGWFADRDEIELIDHGVSDKQELGYIILEWEECAVDQLFIAILRDEETVEDYTVYTRNL